MNSPVVDQLRPDASDRATEDGRARILAWSRAGAIAVVLATRPPSRLLRNSARIALLVAGSWLIAVGVAVMLWSGLGPGPLDVFIGAIRMRTGLSLTLAVWLVMASFIATAWLLGRRPGPGTLLSPLLVGPIMEATVSLIGRVEPPDALVMALAIHVTAVFVVGLGAGALIVSGLGAGSGELLAAAASDRTGRAEPRTRMAIESSLLFVGVVLGGPIGIGTIVVALTIGPAVMVGHRRVDGLVVNCRTRFAAARETGEGPTRPASATRRSTGCRRRS